MTMIRLYLNRRMISRIFYLLCLAFFNQVDGIGLVDESRPMNSPIPVYHSFKEMDVAHNTERLIFNYNQTVLPDEFTVCMSIHSSVDVKKGWAFNLVDEKKDVGLTITESIFFMYPYTKCPSPVTEQIPVDWWAFFCAGFSPDEFTFYFNKTEIKMKMSEMETCFMSAPNAPNMRLQFFGRDPIAFTGSVANPAVYDKIISFDEYMELAACKNIDSNPMEPESFTETFGVKYGQMEHETICKAPAKEILGVFKYQGDKKESSDYCDILNGRLLNNDDPSKDISYGIIDSVSRTNGQYVTYMEADIDSSLCQIERVTIMPSEILVSIVEIPCDSKSGIVACFIPRGAKLVFKYGTINEILYARNVEGVLKLLGENDNNIIIHNNSTRGTQLTYISTSNIWRATLQPTQRVLGRYNWRNQYGDQILATLTMCSDNQFTCNNGLCIPLLKRCDGRPDCPDLTDEGIYCKTIIGPPDTYMASLCPSTNPEIFLSIISEGISDVDLNVNNFQITLQVYLSWKDPRIQFSNLDLSINGSGIKLMKDEENQIWSPQIKLQNSIYQDNVNVINQDSILMKYYLKAERDGRSETLDSYETRVFEGKDVIITRKINYLFTFRCSYEFFTFPFDIQFCHAEFVLQPSTGCFSAWSRDTNNIKIKGLPEKFSMYDVSELRFSYVNDSPNRIRINVLFTRKFESYTLTTFIPCILLMILGQITLTHFSWDNFQDRITVTLSLLIVMASLFSQVVAGLPSSPVPKVLEIFFFYCVLRLAFVFVQHSLIDTYTRSDSEPKPKSKPVLQNVKINSINTKVAYWNEDEEKDKPSKSVPFKVLMINRSGLIGGLLFDVLMTIIFLLIIFIENNKISAEFESLHLTSEDFELYG